MISNAPGENDAIRLSDSITLRKDNVQNSSDSIVQAAPTKDALLQAVDIVEQISDDRGLLAGLGKEDRQRLLRAVDRIACPDRISRKRLVREIRRRKQAELPAKKAKDERLLARTGIRNQQGNAS